MNNNDWQPIQTAPKDGTQILITNGIDVCTARYRISNEYNDRPFFCTTANNEYFNIGTYYRGLYQYINATHWMPLPKPPREDLK